MKKILEIGSGQGYHTYLLSKDKNNDVIGVDFSVEDNKIAQERYPKTKFMYMNAESLKFKNGIFDEVYAMDILEHVDNLSKVLNEVARVLKTGGKFIINIPFYKSEYWLLKVRPTFHKEIHHVRIFKENELDNLLLARKFEIVKKEPREFLQQIELYFLFKRKITSKTQLSIGSWRDNIFTVVVHVAILYFNPTVLKTPLMYFPIWLVTVPIGNAINFFGNKLFPRSLYYEFVKK